MPAQISLRIAGEAGQGMQTIGEALCRMFKNAGLHVFANQDAMSRIRGGNNFFQVRVSSQPVYALRRCPDCLVALDKASIAAHQAALAKDGVIVVDRQKFALNETDPRYFDVPMYALAVEAGGKDIFVNSVACGVIAGISGIGFNYVEQVLTAAFGSKEEDIVRKNVSAARAGYDYTASRLKSPLRVIPAQDDRVPDTSRLVMTGNDSIALGAIQAGCSFYSAYPMSPSTGIMNYLAHSARDFGIIVEQAEDEIAAVNMAIGASFAGARSMTATSGGGFALMAEGISLAGMTETPVVVAVCQRPGPATGFPTRTEQSDLDFVLSAGHGEFARVVYAPGSIEECFSLTVKAFSVAEKFQLPVLILSDQHLAESYRTIQPLSAQGLDLKRSIIDKEQSTQMRDYKRYRLTESGVSPRALPSWIDACIYADSDEHDEQGHITEDADLRVKMVSKRLYKKMAGLSAELVEPSSAGVPKASTVLIGFGSTLGVLKETAEASGGRIGYVHLSQVWPFPSQSMIKLLKGCAHVITVENNATAQLAKLLRRETGIVIERSILKFDGRPFDLDYLLEQV